MPFETKFVCDTCQPPYIFHKITEEDPRKVKCKTPSCPQCRERKALAKSHMKIIGAVKPSQDMNKEEYDKQFVERGAPAFIGGSTRNKAIDETAEIVMKDYGMTDINMGSHLKPGDNCVPKLAPELERKVDDVFNPKVKNNVMGMAGDKLTQSLMNQVNSGAFKSYGDPIARQQADPALKPKINVMHHYTGKPN